MNKVELRKIIGENIRSERLSRSMSIDELAELLELTSGFVGLIERGRRGATAYNIHRISEIFGLSVEKLYMPTNLSKVMVAENIASNNMKHRRLMSLAYDLSDKELDLLLTIIKGVRQLRTNAPFTDEQEMVE